MKPQLVLDRSERARDLQKDSLFNSVAVRKNDASIEFVAQKLDQLKKEVSNLTNEEELFQSSLFQKEIKKLIRLLKLEVPAASDPQFEVVIGVGNQEKYLARYVITVYFDRS